MIRYDRKLSVQPMLVGLVLITCAYRMTDLADWWSIRLVRLIKASSLPVSSYGFRRIILLKTLVKASYRFLAFQEKFPKNQNGRREGSD